MNSKNKKILICSILLSTFLILFGVTYAFFSYTEVTNEIVSKSGKIYMKLNSNSNNIVLDNIFPETYEEALLRDDNIIEFSITGKNTYEEDVYYEIDLEYGDNVNNKTRIDDKYLRFELLDITNPSNPKKLVSNESFSNIDNVRIYVDTFSSTVEETKNFSLRVWYDKNILISDTNPNADFRASNYNDDISPNLSKPIYNTVFSSVKVKVYGDLVYKSFYNVMGRFPTEITNHKNDILEIHCITDIKSNLETRYNSSSIKADVTYNNEAVGTTELQALTDYGKVLAWLEPSIESGKYILYIGSEGPVYLSTGDYLFEGFEYTTIIDIGNIRTKFVTNMNSMFSFCTKLEELNVSNFDTSNVTNFSSMFKSCKKLQVLNLDNFDTSNGINMSFMFAGCNDLLNLDLSNFNTSNVNNILDMFYDCNNLTSLNISSFNTTNVIAMSYLFYNCRSLTTLDLSNFNTSNVYDMSSMFNNCISLTNLNINSFNTNKVQYMDYMFTNCSSLTSLNVTHFDTSKVVEMVALFSGCSSLTSIDVTNFNTSKVESMYELFKDCSSLREINIDNFDTRNITDMGSFFEGCSSLIELDLSNLNLSRVDHTNCMFKNCSSLTKIYSYEWTYSVSTSADMFLGCVSLIGQNGTVYDPDRTEYDYARVDTSDYPGYFSVPESV